MWPTTHGPRFVDGDEARLIRAAIAIMIDDLVAEGREGDNQQTHGIEWFDQWDWAQRLWMLEHVALGLLTDSSPPPPAAMWEATIDAIFAEVRQQIELEIEHPSAMQGLCSWRQSVIDAFRAQQQKQPDLSADSTNVNSWHPIVTQLANAILGVRLYLKAESFRDRDIKQTHKFLAQQGLPSDFLEQIPPMRTADQTQLTIDQLQMLVSL